MIDDQRPATGPDETAGRSGRANPSGLTRGIVWSELAAQMRAEAAAAGDDRFARADALTERGGRGVVHALSPRRTTPHEASSVDLDPARRSGRAA